MMILKNVIKNSYRLLRLCIDIQDFKGHRYWLSKFIWRRSGHIADRVPTALSLKWLTSNPAREEEWTLNKEKLQAVEQLVQEQLEAQHMEDFTSPWDAFIFVIKKKSGKWRTLTDLRATCKVIQPMGSLQSGIPLTSLLPNHYGLL